VNIEGRRPSDCSEERIHASAWLIAPTISLLIGQALAVVPWPIPSAASAASLLPLLLIGWSGWRRRVLLLVLSLVALSLGYMRHRDLLFPEFPENHLRAVMSRDDKRVYLEGTLRHEPEKLVNRTRWQVAAERIWHPSGAEEITGEFLGEMKTVEQGVAARLAADGQR